MRSSLSCCLAVSSALFLMSMDALAAPLCVQTNDPAIPAAYRCPAGATDVRARPRATTKAEQAAQAAEAKKFAQALRNALLQGSAGANSGSGSGTGSSSGSGSGSGSGGNAAAEAAAKARAEAERQAAARREAEERAAEQRRIEAMLAGKTPASGSKTPWSVRLKWIIPSSRENGQPLMMTDLAGYELYYVSEDETKSGIVAINRADQAEYVLGNLDPGAYFFAISAIDRNGLKSRLSPLVRTAVGS